jgi:hypothetical protein
LDLSQNGLHTGTIEVPRWSIGSAIQCDVRLGQDSWHYSHSAPPYGASHLSKSCPLVAEILFLSVNHLSTPSIGAENKSRWNQTAEI